MGEVVEVDFGPCPECRGLTIEFRGTGKNVQYRICTRWEEPGHLSEEEVKKKLWEKTMAHMPPSGRFA
jgi:hypothetical protein